MDKVKKPRGLIRYDSYDGISKGVKLSLNARNVFYSVILTALLFVFSFLLTTRTPIETSILRTPGVLYQETEDGYLTNLYNIKVINKTREPKPIELKLHSPAGEISLVGGDIVVPEGKLKEAVFFVKLKKETVKMTSTPIQINILSGGEVLEEIDTSFLGPNPYLKK
jgi:polyferredoxin